MEDASGHPGANLAGGTDDVDELCDKAIKEEAAVEAAVAGLDVAAREKRDSEQTARDRQEAIEREIPRCERMLKDTKAGKQGRHK